MPLVSICLPNLNTRPFLEPRMASLRAQTLTDWELIISDNYSDDGSWAFFQQWAGDKRVTLFQAPRRGMYANWNECLRRARGEFVYVATSDDTCHSQLLERLVGALERHSDADLAACDFDFIDEKGRVMSPPPRPVPPDEFLGPWRARSHRRRGTLELLVHLCIGISWTTMTAVVFRRRLLDKIGLFPTEGGATGDRYWAIKSALHTDLVWIPERLATWRYHSDQGSARVPLSLRRRQMELTEQTLRECEALIPAQWKRDPAWFDKLMWGSRQFYRLAFCLDRRALLVRPHWFLKGLWAAWREEPQYLRRRWRERFSWQHEDYLSNGEYLRRLIAEWRVPGPLEVLKG